MILEIDPSFLNAHDPRLAFVVTLIDAKGAEWKGVLIAPRLGVIASPVFQTMQATNLAAFGAALDELLEMEGPTQ
jgi:hypothetical protein